MYGRTTMESVILLVVGVCTPGSASILDLLSMSEQKRRSAFCMSHGKGTNVKTTPVVFEGDHCQWCQLEMPDIQVRKKLVWVKLWR